MTHTDKIAIIDAAQTFLFVPGDRPERFDKAIASGADVVVIDLEDAVAPDAKNVARTAVARWISPVKPVMLRVNACDTSWFEDDLALARERGILGILLPKAEPNAATARVAETSPTVALIESARGVAGMLELGSDHPGMCRFALGDIDLSLDLGITASPAIFDPIRLQMVVVSRLRGLAPPIDGVSLNIDGGGEARCPPGEIHRLLRKACNTPTAGECDRRGVSAER